MLANNLYEIDMNRIKTIFFLSIPEQHNRTAVLDYIRGLLVFLILWHHAGAPLSEYVLQFHMPALFLLSGFTEYYIGKSQPFLPYVKKKFWRLVAPYVCFECMNLGVHIVLSLLSGGDSISLTDAITSIILCNNSIYMGLYGRLWFLPVMFFSAVFSHLINGMGKRSKLIPILTIPALFVLSYMICAKIPYRIPFALDTAIMGTAFYLLGVVLGPYIRNVLDSHTIIRDICVAVAFILLFVGSNYYGDPYCYMYINQYGDYPIMLIAAVSGSFVTFIIGKWVYLLVHKCKLLDRVITWYSYNSLAVFPVHLLIKVVIVPGFVWGKPYTWIVLLVYMFVLTIPVVNLITSCFPFMLGKLKRRPKQPA